MAVTSWSRSNASFKMADPTNPVAPINAIFIMDLIFYEPYARCIHCSHRDTCPRAASTLQMPDPWDEMYRNVKQ